MYIWELSQQNEIAFVLVDSNGNEVAGLGGTFTVQIRKAGEVSFANSGGTKSEIANGWYSYVSTASEADTPGTVGIKVTGAGAVQQNLLAEVRTLNINAVEFTYTLTDSTTGNPIDGASIWIATDTVGNNVVWSGITDSFGVARNSGNLPRLDPGTYYVFRSHSSYSFSDPDTEVVV